MISQYRLSNIRQRVGSFQRNNQEVRVCFFNGSFQFGLLLNLADNLNVWLIGNRGGHQFTRKSADAGMVPRRNRPRTGSVPNWSGQSFGTGNDAAVSQVIELFWPNLSNLQGNLYIPVGPRLSRRLRGPETHSSSLSLALGGSLFDF